MSNHKYANVYAMVDPRSGKKRYIGQTVRTLAVRLQYHIAQPATVEMREWFEDLKSVGMRPQMLLLARVPYKDRKTEEAAQIERHLKMGAKLLNSKGNPQSSRSKKRGANVSERKRRNLYEFPTVNETFKQYADQIKQGGSGIVNGVLIHKKRK